MNTLKLIQESNQHKLPEIRHEELRIREGDDLIDLFPLPRYFQVHFQHVHENAHELQGELTQLKDYVLKVDEKLERLLALLSRTSEAAF